MLFTMVFEQNLWLKMYKIYYIIELSTSKEVNYEDF